MKCHLTFKKNKVQKIHLINIKEYYTSNVMEYKKEGAYVIKMCNDRLGFQSSYLGSSWNV